MAFDSGGGVVEGFGDDGHRCEFGELVEGTESCGPGAEQLAEARCVLGRDAVRSRPGFAASSRHGLSRGSGRAIWMDSSWMVTSSSVTVASFHVSRAMFSACSPKMRMRVAAALSRASAATLGVS
jgi:hypothetical protein